MRNLVEAAAFGTVVEIEAGRHPPMRIVGHRDEGLGDQLLRDAFPLRAEHEVREDAAGATVHEAEELGIGSRAVRPRHQHVEVLHVGDDDLHRVELGPVPRDVRQVVVEGLCVVLAQVDDAVVLPLPHAADADDALFQRHDCAKLFAALEQQEVGELVEVVLAGIAGTAAPQAPDDFIDVFAQHRQQIGGMPSRQERGVEVHRHGATIAPGIRRLLSHKTFNAVFHEVRDVALHRPFLHAGPDHDQVDGGAALLPTQIVAGCQLDLVEQREGAAGVSRNARRIGLGLGRGAECAWF